MRKVFKIIKGSDETIKLQIRRVDTGDPFPLTNVLSVYLRVESESGYLLKKGSIASSSEGKIEFALTSQDTAALKEKNGQALEVILKYTAGTVAAAKAIQDLTYTADDSGEEGNSISVTYEDGGTAGSEVVTVQGSKIIVSMEDGVSTATQIKAAVDAHAEAAALVAVSITGTGSDAQDETEETFLTGGLPTKTVKRKIQFENCLEIVAALA